MFSESYNAPFSITIISVTYIYFLTYQKNWFGWKCHHIIQVVRSFAFLPWGQRSNLTIVDLTKKRIFFSRTGTAPLVSSWNQYHALIYGVIEKLRKQNYSETVDYCVSMKSSVTEVLRVLGLVKLSLMPDYELFPRICKLGSLSIVAIWMKDGFWSSGTYTNVREQAFAIGFG